MLKYFLYLMLIPVFLHSAIYDCFTFFNELELLHVRLEELYDSVDKFVLVEGKKSFTGKDKPLYFNDNVDQFARYKDKIIHLIIEDFPCLTGDPEKDHWAREAFSRNYILYGLKNCHDDDVIFISDLDEIPNKHAIKKAEKFLSKRANEKGKHLKDKHFVCNLNMRLFMYRLDRENKQGWCGGSKAAPFWMIKKYLPWGIKIFHQKHDIPFKIENAGWHLNTMGGEDRSLYKWLNTGPIFYEGLEDALHRYEENSELLHQSFENQLTGNTVQVEIDSSYPKYIRENIDYFRSIGWLTH